eukprot:4359672-Pleurochrysis_carterae.AAC.1
MCFCYIARSQLRARVDRRSRPSAKCKAVPGDGCGLDRLIAAHSLPVNALLMASATTDVTD